MLLQTSKLTNGERLRTARRRAGRTQDQWARRFRVSLTNYKRAEADAENAPPIRAPAVGRLRGHEACRIERQRRGWTLDDLSTMIGLSKWWLCLIEQGKAPTASLLEFWTR